LPAGVVFKDCFLEIMSGTVSTEISTFVRSARMTMGPDEVEDTAVSDSTHTFFDGLQNHRIAATLKMGYETGGPEQVLSPIILNGTQVSVEMRRSRILPVGANNARFRMTAAKILGADYAPVGGDVGALVESPIAIVPVSGSAIIRTIV
jgi:hypothetical protein